MAAFTKGFSPWRKRGSFRRLSPAEKQYYDLVKHGEELTPCTNETHIADLVVQKTLYTEYLSCRTCVQQHDGKESYGVQDPDKVRDYLSAKDQYIATVLGKEYHGDTSLWVSKVYHGGTKLPLPDIPPVPQPTVSKDTATKDEGWSPPLPDPFNAKGEKSTTFTIKPVFSGSTAKVVEQSGTKEQTVTTDSTTQQLAQVLSDLLARSLDEGRVTQMINTALAKYSDSLQGTLADTVKALQEVGADLKQGGTGPIIVKVNDVPVTLPDGVTPHSQMKDVLSRLSIKDDKGRHVFTNFLLRGEAGTGKTTMAQHLALALGFDKPDQFVAISIVPDMPSSALMGRVLVKLSDGTETYIPSALVPIMLDGGLIFLDEADNADPQILIALNSLTANGFVRLPNGDLIQRHPRCFVGMGMNTNGDGASRTYTRAQLDAAFLDRFTGAAFEIKYCSILESKLCPEESIRQAVYAVRKVCREKGIRRVVSTRFLMAVRSMVHGENMSIKKAISAATAMWTDADRAAASI